MSDFDRMMSDSLKGIRNEHLKQIEAQVPAARQELGMKLRKRRFTFVVGGVAVAAAAVAAIVFIAQTVPKVDRSAPIRPAGEPVVMARIDVPGVASMETGVGKVWVSHQDGLSGIDPASSEVEIESPVDGVEDMAATSEAVFAINSGDRTLSRLPFGTDEAATSVGMEGTPTVVTASEEAVWVAAAVGPVGDSQIFAYTPELEQPGNSAAQVEGLVVADMTHGDDALWMTVSQGPNTAPEVRRFFDGGGESAQELSQSEGTAADIVVGEGAAWVLRHPTQTGGNTITRIDLETDEVVERAVNFRESIESIAVGEGYLWVTTAPLGMNMPEDARATLYRIDPNTLEQVGEPIEVSGPGSKLAVGSGFVWVGDPNAKQIVQIDPSGSSSPEPAPSTPEPEDTEPAPSENACLGALPFEPSSDRWTAGVGSGGGQPLQNQAPAPIVHYRDVEDEETFVEVMTHRLFSMGNRRIVEVLGDKGAVGSLEVGYGIEFEVDGCEYQLLGYEFDEQEAIDFARSLVFRGEAGLTQDHFALWPEQTPEEAYATCKQPQGLTLSDSKQTAISFAEQVLGWEKAEIDESFIMNAGSGFEGYRVLRDDSEGAPRILVLVREVAVDCWHVSSVRTANQQQPDDEETGLGISHRDGETLVAFDLEGEAAGHPVDSVQLMVGPGRVVLSRDEFERKGFIRLTDEPMRRPSALLVLLLDEDDEVVGAIGQSLPSGDFAAG